MNTTRKEERNRGHRKSPRRAARRDKKTAGATLHGSRPGQENAEGTNWAKQRTYVKTSRKVRQRYNQEGARDGTRSDSHLATKVKTNDRQASPRTKEKQRESA